MGSLAPWTPPPYLSDDELRSLARRGCLTIQLSSHLEQLYTELFTTLSEDFFPFPSATKQNLYPSKPNTTELGYQSIPGEKQFITFRHDSTQCHRSIADDPHAKDHAERLDHLIREIWTETAPLLHRILYDLARALGSLDPMTLWSPMLENSESIPSTFDSSAQSFIRTFQYEPNKGISDPHTDLGLLTLCIPCGEGLQVKTYDPAAKQLAWMDADLENPTVLVGSTLMHFLGNKNVRPGMHQVVGNPEGRMSAIFALRANLNAEVDMAMFGRGEEGVVKVREWWKGLCGSRFNVNVAGRVREEQREQMRLKELEEGGKSAEEKSRVAQILA